MARAPTKPVTNSEIRMIPLAKLKLSPKNVRKTPATAAEDDELYASIKTIGVKQNLLVHEADGSFQVHAGGRRLYTLQKLVEDGHLKAGHKVPCRVEDPSGAEEASTAENMVRANMHPADQFEAFASLVEKGRSEEEIASQFGITVDLVRRRQKLARVAPEILQAFRQDEMSLDCVMAFTLTDDRARQKEIWETVSRQHNPAAHYIRRLLTERSYSANSKLGRFVGVETYREAGGSTINDLFSERDAVHLQDPDLLERLAEEKLQGLAEELAKTWKWAEPHMETDYNSFRKYGRVYPQPLDPDPKLEAELADLHEQEERLETEYDEETWTDEMQAQEDKVLERIREIENIRNENVAFTDQDHAIAGCIVSIGFEGDVRIETGLVRPEDIPEPVEAETNEPDDAPSVPSVQLPASSRPSMPVDPVTAARKEKGVSQSLADDLRATRHQILKAHLAADYDTAFDVMLYTMCRDVIKRSGYTSALDVSLRQAAVHNSKDVLKDTVAARMLDAVHEGLNIAWMELKAPEDFEALSGLSLAEKQALFAWCAAHGLNQQLATDGNPDPVIERIGMRMEVDVAQCWRPTADTYWGRVKKNHIVDVARALIGDRWANENSGGRKAQIAKAAELAFGENAREEAGLPAEVAEKTAVWLPDGMAFENVDGSVMTNVDEVSELEPAEVSGAGETDETSDDVPSSLPAFLSDAAE